MLSAIVLAAAAWQLSPIDAARAKYNLQPPRAAAEESIAEELQLPVVSLSVFRSLIIDYLWIRAENLKENGQFFDALHLSRMICAMQPHLASVWDYQAWNMAYNISVSLPTAPERWHWVKAGIALIRDRGLVYNPKNPKLYWSIAWIFQHKIGGFTDDFNRYYKEQLAFEMMPLLSPLLMPLGTPVSNKDFAELVKAPRSWGELMADKKVASLIDKIKKAEPKFKNKTELINGLVDMRLRPGYYHTQLHKLLLANKASPAWHKIDVFVRSWILRNKYKLLPVKMQALNKRYGPINLDNPKERLPLDWRLPDVQAIYWARLGLDQAKKKTGHAQLKLYRIIYHGLQNLYHYGHLQIMAYKVPAAHPSIKPGQDVAEKPSQVKLNLFNSQDLRMLEGAWQATRDVLKAYKDAGERKPGGIDDGAINLLRSGITNLYLLGREFLARKYYNLLRKTYPDSQKNWPILAVFVRNKMKEEISDLTPKNASDYIIGLLRDGYSRYAIGDDENATLRAKWARKIYEIIQKDFPVSEDPTQRITLPSYSDLQWTALMDFFNDTYINPAVKGTLLGRLKLSQPKLYNKVLAELKKQLRKSQKLQNNKPQKP